MQFQVTTIRRAVLGGLASIALSGPALAACNPCAVKKPCAPKTASACAGCNPCNPCAAKNPCNPCAAQNPCNPCAAKNPCNPCAAQNPCNPCAAGGAAKDMKDPVAEKVAALYKDWLKVNDDPVLSATHGNRLVFTYINEEAESAAMGGGLPFPEGAVLAKESFVDNDGTPGAAGPVFIMEKRGEGYDADNGNWHYAMVQGGKVQLTGNGQQGSPTQFCAGCHTAVKSTDYVYGNGTTMKLK